MNGLHSWFECKVSYEKATDTGAPKRTSESYLVDAVAFMDAEKRVTEELEPFVITGEFVISNIKRPKIAEIFDSSDPDDDRYYRVKVLFVQLDEKNGVEKKTPATMLVKANSLKKAVERIDEEMRKSMADFEIASVTDTNIMDIFRYEAKD